MARKPAPAEIQQRWQKLRALADRPGTVHEGKAAQRAMRRLEKRYELVDELPHVTVSASLDKRQVTAVACWVAMGRTVTLSTAPLDSDAVLEDVRVQGGTGHVAESEGLRICQVRAVCGGQVLPLRVGARIPRGWLVEVVLTSRWLMASRVSVHLRFASATETPIVLLELS